MYIRFECFNRPCAQIIIYSEKCIMTRARIRYYRHNRNRSTTINYNIIFAFRSSCTVTTPTFIQICQKRKWNPKESLAYHSWSKWVWNNLTTFNYVYGYFFKSPVIPFRSDKRPIQNSKWSPTSSANFCTKVILFLLSDI